MNTSSRTSRSRNPIELVDRYLQAVRFWVPKAQQDLVTELGEDLRSQIEERETEVGHPLDEAEVSAILKRCGSPMVVASRLGPKRYVIGPPLYPIYRFVLKMVLLWILVPVFVFIIGPVNLANSGNWGTAVLRTFGDLWSGLFIAAGVITLVFAVLERTHPQMSSGAMEKAGVADAQWDPRTLPPLQKQERKPSLIQTACEMGFGIFGLIWVLLLPHYPVLILGPAAAFLKGTPMWHTFYVPILLLGVWGLLRAGVTLARPQWAWFPPVSQLLQTVLTLILLNFMIDVARTVDVNGAWQPFVMVADGIRDSAHYARIAAIVNASILLSLAGTWLGLCIAGVVQTWQVVRYSFTRNSGTRQPASIPVK